MVSSVRLAFKVAYFLIRLAVNLVWYTILFAAVLSLFIVLLAVALGLSYDRAALLETIYTGIGVFSPTKTLSDGVAFVSVSYTLLYFLYILISESHPTELQRNAVLCEKGWRRSPG